MKKWNFHSFWFLFLYLFSRCCFFLIFILHTYKELNTALVGWRGFPNNMISNKENCLADSQIHWSWKSLCQFFKNCWTWGLYLKVWLAADASPTQVTRASEMYNVPFPILFSLINVVTFISLWTTPSSGGPKLDTTTIFRQFCKKQTLQRLISK